MTNSYAHQRELAEDRFALQVTARLSDAANELPYDISERLRASRVRALSKRKLALKPVTSNTIATVGHETLALGGEHHGWWDRLVALLPILVLALGLVAISMIQDDILANELAEIDAALLTDDLPPAAYTDPGFAQFLRINAGHNP